MGRVRAEFPQMVSIERWSTKVHVDSGGNTGAEPSVIRSARRVFA